VMRKVISDTLLIAPLQLQTDLELSIVALSNDFHGESSRLSVDEHANLGQMKSSSQSICNLAGLKIMPLTPKILLNGLPSSER